MKRSYVIQCSLSNTSVIEDRIKQMGKWYKYFSNSWLIETEFTAKEIYEKLSIGYDKESFLILEITGKNYYGRMKTDLWEWLKNRI